MIEQNGTGPNEKSPGGHVMTETDTSPPRGNPFPIVGIGASAGGLEAFGQLLSALPADTGMAFVLVQHLDPLHESLLPELLAGRCSMPVLTVHDGLKVQPNSVYVIPPNSSMELTDGVLSLVTREPGLHLPIDTFFRSLARVQGSRAIGIVLSGNASDGSLGVRAIKAECGLTFAQNEESARFGGMPRNAAATGAVDYVLSPEAIAQELNNIAHHPYLIPSRRGDPTSEALPEDESELRRIFALLHNSSKVDFSRYKPTTVRRRVGRRMMILRVDTVREYARHVERHPEELRDLYRDLLISVTSFFRDPASYRSLTKLIAQLIGNRESKEEPVRVWVPGCATGEEVYSLAICVFELLGEMQLSLPLQLFGTDISEPALDRARKGIYPAGIEEDVEPERLRRFFGKVDSGYQISKVIRESCVFARHDVTRDPPFSNLDLVSCRNLLIYLDQAAQRHVLPVVHYALKPNGLLTLGSAESTAAVPDLFDVLDAQCKIYARRATPPRLPLDVHMGGPLAEMPLGLSGNAISTGAEIQKRLDRVIQTKYSPDAVLITAEFNILQFRGHTNTYLEPSPGPASLNLLRMAKESLVLPLRRAVQNAAETNGAIREQAEIDRNGITSGITLEVTPIPGVDPNERYFLVVFVRDRVTRRVEETETGSDLVPADEQVSTVQRELADAREYIRNLTEQYEAHSEELRAANEEARSANEELQSTNEELRTTKEELQSANEELTTVNEELQSRNNELNATNSDLTNLLGSVTIPILMVDSDLRVRRFNTSAAKLLELSPVDIGRPVGHLRGRIETPKLEEQVKAVVETLTAHTEEMQDIQGCWHLLNIRPYRTVDDRIAGAVITLQDIDPLKRGLKAAEEARDYAEGMIETVREPLVVIDSDLRVERATKAFYDAFLVSRDETEGRFLYDLGNGQWNQPALREAIGNALFRSQPFHDFEIDHEFPHIGQRVVRLNGRRIPFPHSQKRMLLLSIEDVTERREIAEIRFQRLFETAKDGIIVVDVETRSVRDVNPYFLEFTGYGREDFVGRSVKECGEKLGLSQVSDAIEITLRSEIIRCQDSLKTRNRGLVTVDVVGNRYEVGSQPVIQFNIRDVSAREHALRALRESEQRFRLFVESVHDYALFQTDPEGRILSWNTGAERLLGWKEKEAVGQTSALVFTPEDIAKGAPRDELETARKSGRAEDERWHVRKDGTRFFASGVLTQVCDQSNNLVGFAKVMRDVTSRREQEEQLRRSLDQKDTLVREIHHRVKNNIQVIVSLLSLQSNHTNDPHVLSAFEEAESRLRAIAHIHERLYASDDLTEVEFAGYTTGLANELVQLHSPRPDHIALDLDVADMVLHIEQAIPLGLIANELVLNSLKHGLRGDPGRLTVKLLYIPGQGETLDSGSGQLIVSDSGTGLPPGFDVTKNASLGLRLVNMLVRQLHGQLEFSSASGATFAVTFPIEFKSTSSRAEE